MAGETQRRYAVKELDAESKLQDEGTALEQFTEKTTKESSEHFTSAGTETRTVSRVTTFVEKERDYTQQREAVIRPQQAGKIDFKSLQNRPKFSSDRTWPGGKGSPQSPTGKNRNRDKGKRSGKSERGNPQQLYRLSITNPRANPTIGIAYPQQKVSPPKKLEASRGPVSGSYRFHVPSIPEREAELQQEELNFSRCFQETSSNLTTPSYTSQALGSTGVTSTHHPPLSQQQQQQQPGPMENNNTQPGSQLLFPDFQMSASNSWQSPERTFNGANYGISSQKSTVLPETNKANGSFVPLPFQYGYQLLEDSTPDPFPCDQNPQPQDYIDSSLAPGQVTHNSFSFQTSGEGQDVVQNNTQFNNEQSEDRSSYSHPPQPPQYLQAPQGASSSMHCPRGLNEDSASSESSGSSSQQSEQSKSALPESTEAFGQQDNRDAALASGSKTSCHPKDGAANQRTRVQGSVHHARNIAQGPSSQMHFPNKAFNSPPLNNIHMGSVPFDKSINNKVHSRLPQSWEGPSKAFSPVEQNAMPYPNMNDKFQFQSQPALDQRPNTSKSSRMPWQQIRLTSAIPNQNRIELSRQLSNQKMTYLVSPSDWQEDSKSHKNGSLKSPNSFQNNRINEGFSNPRQDSVKQSCSTISSFKVETSHAQVCDSKNKPIYFGLNQSLPGASSRTYGYPPLQVPPMGLMMVSPYESPLPSPVHNPNSSSTCSSLSPASTSPVNLSSEDSQITKAGPPPPFYHQHQVKAQAPTDHLSTNPHLFHSDNSRNLPYAPERAKDDMMSYLQNNGHPKTSMDGNKGYMDSFGVDHHPPPPPYSAHQLLATSLATANLDQLDVLLTCKQCDQNFTNLASFLGHKQYCGQHAFAQNDFKDMSKVEDTRKFHTDMSKATSSSTNLCQGVSIPRLPSDLHLSLLGLNKNGELMSDSETKGDSKEDPMKLNLFAGANNLPVSLPDLEMEDAKLDSLITEALNGLGYQSDNAEIDSSFIDAFADDDLTTVKVTSNRQTLKTKDFMVFESKSKQATDDDSSLIQGKYLYDSDIESLETDNKHTENKLEKTPLNLKQDEKINIKKEVSHKNSRMASGEKSREQENKVKQAIKLCKSEDETTNAPRFLLSTKFSERCGVKSYQDSSLRGSTPSQASTVNTSSTSPRIAARESKRKRTGAGTWSKELIHKIVQQKNKLHKLSVKGTKNLQFSLVMERLTPTVQNPTFGEYDYVSDSDDECEPVKIASQGRLSQSNRCKYTYTKECKWRARSERDRAAWRHESKECFEVKKAEDISLSPEKHGSHQRLVRRGSRSSTSSELSTSVSISSDSINSPKSTDHTDSDCEKKMETRRKDSPEQKTYERSPQKICKESSTHLSLTFTKSTKRYNGYQTLLSANKDNSVASKIHNSNYDDPITALPKVRGPVKKLEKCRNTDVSSREKEGLCSREIILTASSAKITPLRIDIKTPKGESIHLHPINTDLKLHQLESHPAANNNKETSSHKNDETISKGKSVYKRRESGGSQAIPPKSKLSTFEKQSDRIYPLKEPINLVNKLVPKTTTLCSGLMNEVCLSPTELQEPLTQKETCHLIPYPLEQDQSLMKSPLSFDTSSMFGDLTVAGFDNGLYTDIPLHKDGFNSLEPTSDKKEVFGSSFSPFLEQRDWGLMVDVSPMLPDEISQYKDDSDRSNEKKSDYNHVPLSLPDKIMDYSANLSSCVSEDELEIKRIVTELENQLQTAKMSSPQLLTENSPKQLKMSKFSPLRLDNESDSEDTGLDIGCPVQSMAMAVSSMPSEPFTEPGLPWSSPFQFELMDGHQSPHTPTHTEPGVLEHLTENEDDAHSIITTASNAEKEQLHQEDHKLEETDDDKRTAIEKSEEILESKMYAENLMKSLEVISDSIFRKDPVTPDLELNIAALNRPEQLHGECQAPTAAEDKDHSEKDVIPNEENFESIMNETQPLLSEDTDITSDAKQAISLLSSESVENHNNTSEPKEISMVEDITEVSSMIEGAYCSNMKVDNPQVTEETCDKHNMEDCGDKIHNDIGDQPELSDLLDAPIDDHKEIGPVEDINLSTLPVSPPSVSNLAEQKIYDDFDNKLDAIENACEERPIKIQNNPEVGCCSPSTEELKEGNSACMKEEGMIESNTTTQVGLISHIAPPTCSTPENDVANQTTHISMEKVTDKPYSPLLMETNIEHASHSSPFANIETTDGESTMLVLEEPDNLLSNNAHISTPEDKATTEIDPECQTIQKEREEIPNVEDIHEQVPTDLMATAQISICREDLQINDSQGLTLEAAPPSSPFQPISSHTPTESAVMQEEQGQSQSTLQDIQSPREESCDDLNVKEALHNDEPLGITAEMEYSLISPPQLDLGITESKISSTEASIPSVLPLTNITEPSDVLDALPKSGTLYNFKLSPLNYNDEPPQLNQYDYIPISPVNSGVEEEPTNKQSPRDDCEPCDLSHDTAPMSNKTMTDIDTELPMSPEHSARLSQPDESLGNNSIENNLQFPGIPLGFPSKCSSPSTDNIKEDLDICPTPLATIDYLDLHVDLLKRVDPEILDIHEVPCEQDAPPSIEDISDDQHTHKPLIICENESTIPLPCPSPSPSNKPEPQIAVEAQYSQKLEEDTFQKKTSSQTHITQQGKVVCEICSMCFRTVPGLKRHKAMKHLVRTDRGPLENAPSIHTYQPSQCIDTAHKGDIGLQDIQACLQTGNNGISENHCPQIINNSLTAKQGETDLVLEDTASETTRTMTSDEIGQKMPPLLTKVKRSYKARKTKSTEMNIKPDPFSDELLNILKTDILQAITPEFQTRVQQGSCKSPERQEEMNSHVNHNVTEEREVPFTIAVNSGIEDVSASETEETNVLSQTMDVNQSKIDTEEVKVTILPEIDNGVTEVSTDVSIDYGVSVSKDISREYDESRDISEDMKEMCEQQTSDESLATDIMGEVAVEIKCEKNCSPTDEVDPLSCFKSPPASPPGLSPDLKAFLDDESTFSQLFPRDEEMKRKKCARVYGKRNKRQKLSPDSPIAQEYPSLDIFPEKKDQYTENEHCEYETISIDDAIMLNMCHNSTLKSDAKKVVGMKGDINHQDIHDNTEELGSDLLCPTESTIDKASIAWSGSNNLNSIVTDAVISPDPSSCKAEVSTTPCPIIASSAPYPEEPCGTDNVPPFHSIDIQNPNTTFQLPEIQFFDSNKDISVAGLIVPDDMEIKEIAKPKKPTERRGRKRQDGSIKIKDKQYKCKVCFTWFLTLGELNFHKLSHNPSPPPTCYMCVQRKFSSREQLRDHLREKHAKNKAGIWTCGMCLKEISDVWMYNEHLREHATQFARKGQTQSSMLGMPGCFMQETAVKNFITSIMQRRPSKANRESSKVAGKEQGKVATETTKQEAKTTEGPEPKVIKTKSSCGGSVKQNTLTPVEVLHKTETAPKNMEMHPNCKDPSRDCHHCGKQFPKPFKLQRHLVVHNLHKIFLCHKCPVSYQEPQELKDHLKSEHEEVDELDSKHTTLYTCELCADVMHVIKKSFICSTCNYTFSKKEQFDRHMEKHLSGGNKIFKFRGVLRPIKASASKDEECDLPTSKKRKILTESLQENSSDSGIASIASMHLNQSTEMQALKPTIPTTEDSTQTSAAEYNTDTNDASVKTEDIAEDYSDILGELKHCSFHMGSSECESLSTATPKTEDIDPSHSLKLPIRDICEGDDKSFTEPCDVKEEDDSLCNREETMSQWLAPKENGAAEEEGSIQIITVEAEEKRMERRDSTTSNEELYIRVHENMINSSKTPDSHHGHDLHHPSTKHKTSAIVMDQMREDEQGQHSTSNYNNDNKQKDLFSPNGSEQQCSSQAKDKASPTKPSESTKQNSTNCPRVIESMPVFHTKLTSMGSTLSEDKDSVRQQKKRKEMKSPNSLQRVSSPATRENLGIDARTKKKFRPSKCESPSVHRKSDGPSDYPVLSSVRDDVVSNKIVSKHKTGSLGLQPKRTSLDNCPPKKAEILHHLNGDYKAKKGPPGRPLHFPVSKVSTPPMNNSLSKSRPKTGVRSMETHAYRTAESQNNLLSQLFGQKLTSFKIPLRKDTSESIN